MNQGIYRLLFSKALNMYVPVSEATRSHSSNGTRRARKVTKSAFKSILLFCFIVTPSVWAAPAGLIPGTQAWINATITGVTNNSQTITQTAPKAILDWQKLNLNAGELLKFNQQGNTTWSALNRIHDLNPSILNGNVQADGNVYFINTNGIIFGPNAQFNVGSLYAGTLDITNGLFNTGFINSDGISTTKVFQGVGGFVTVEKGAQINAISGGKVLLFAPTVTNNGIINTPDGQTILAAGNTVYLASSKDPAGFLVEVDAGGKATNLGSIVAERGNITMMGLAVNQSGILTATTSVRANGSIRLLAQDSASGSDANKTGARNGYVNLAQGSVTQINPEYANKEETITSQPFTTSNVTIEASLVNIDGTLSVKGGNVNINATNPASSLLTSYLDLNQNPINPNNLVNRVYLGNDALIDVSGVDAVAPMSRNQLEIQLFSDQLKDAPILRNTTLFKSTVYVDARKGTQLFDIQPFLDLQGATVAEKMTKAGNVSITTTNEVIADKGSVINVSGGSTTYTPGTIRETDLYYNGQLVPISQAKPGIPYDQIADIYTIKDSKWGVTRGWDLLGGNTKGWGDFVTVGSTGQINTTIAGSQVAGYFNGADAGVISIAHPTKGQVIQNLLLSGTLLANTKVSTQQDISQSLPKGGTLVGSSSDLLIANNTSQLDNGFSFNQSLANTVQSSINTGLFAQGFNNVDLTNVTNIVVKDDIHVNPNGNLTLGGNSGTTAQINANIIASGSNVTLGSQLTNIANGVTISTAGNFTNDKMGIVGQFSTPTAKNAGNIKAGVVAFGSNVSLDASAGAWIDSNGVLNKGNAGNVKFTTTSKLDDSLSLKAYGFNKGGTLDVSFGLSGQERTLNIAGSSIASPTSINVSNDFFNQGGFSKYSLSGLNVNVGSAGLSTELIYGKAQTWQMNDGFMSQSGGKTMAAVATTLLQPDASRAPVSFNFASKNTDPNNTGGILTLAQNATIRTDIGGSVTLSAGKQVNVLGNVSAPSGTINININDNDVSGTLAYDPTQAIFIGPNAVLSATGSSITLPNSLPEQLKTQIFNAGTITIDAPKGALVVKEGALLDVSGTSITNDTKTTTGFVRETLYGDAGTINLSASDGLLLDGTFKGMATGSARAGSLNLGFTNAQLNGGGPLLGGSREFTVTQQKQLTAQNFALGDTLKNSTGNIYDVNNADIINGQISAEQIQQGGFANLKINSPIGSSLLNNSIQLAGDLNLKVLGNLQFETQLLNVKNDGLATLNASAINFQSANIALNNAGIALGNGALDTHSDQFYINGLMAISGVNKTSINTRLDISGQGDAAAGIGLAAPQGGIVANGNINLNARQLYPTTDGNLHFEAIGSNGTITISSSGEAAKPVYSAAGILSLKAANVVQSGVLTAPFGQISIDASTSAIFTPGSLTSVSANNLIIPYGTTITGGEVFNPTGVAGQSGVPLNKNITIKSANIDLQKKAVLDLSSGGDMVATEWVPGIGGTKDILSQPNMYAIIPSLGQDYAPGNTTAQIGIGHSVYLTGVPGLSTGNYTLLPASYALVPGAFLIQAHVANNVLLPTQTARQLDGSTLTTGYLSDLGTGAHDANWSTFSVTDGAIFHPAIGTTSLAPSQYILTSATKFFSDPVKTNGQVVSLPIDVAGLSLDATNMTLDSTVLANKQVDGRGLQVDISSQNIRVVSSTDPVDVSSLQLSVDSINTLNADSLLLGGKRSLQNGITQITTTADNVSIENNSSNTIKVPELIATGLKSVSVKSGAAVDTGPASKTANKTVISTSGDGALLALSSTADIAYSRTGGSASSSQGELDVVGTSSLIAGHSVVLDATYLAKLDGTVTLQDGGSATFGANSILIGNAPLGIAGLNLNAGTLASLGQLKSLTLNSYNNIDTYGAVSFGNNQLDLTLNAGGIAGHLGDGETLTNIGLLPVASVITAKNFTLTNTNNAAFVIPVDASGRGLQINAGSPEVTTGNVVSQAKVIGSVNLVGKDSTDLSINSGKTEISGFSNIAITADEIKVSKQGEVNFNVPTTTLNTGRITADSAADFKISASSLEVSKLNNAIIGTQSGIGANLAVQADDIKISGNIDLSSGQLEMTAMSTLSILNGGKISTTSTANTFYSTTLNAPAGSITLTSNTGNVVVDSGALVDVSASGEADAGLLKVVANSGTALIYGELKGTISGNGKGGSLDVSTNTLSDLTLTNSQAIGFSDTRQFHVLTGDVNISGTALNGNALIARDIIVNADAGKINVTGDVVATAPKNGHIGLFASNGITLASTANLMADSTASASQGGKIDVYTTGGQLDLKVGSSIDVSGGAGAAGGMVLLRAPRTGLGSGNGVAVAELGTSVKGASSTVLEGFKIFNGVSTINTGTGTGVNLGFTTIQNDVNNFMGNESAILSSLNKALDPTTFHWRLQAGTEIQSTGNLTVGSDWNLYSNSRTGNEPSILTLRAKGNIIFNGSLSDGFNGSLTTAVIGVGDSTTYRIVAGADTSAANPLATIASAKDTTGNAITGNVSIATNKIIRTGTGSIDIAAGGDLKMGTAAAIYTAGLSDTSITSWFDAPANNLNPLYLTGGGNIRIVTKGSIVGAEPLSGRQLINEWLFREGGGTGNLDTSWWVRPDLFKQSLATLGGGNINIDAGGNISNFSASAPTTARFDTNGTTGNQSINGGGDLTVNAGGNINNGVYFVAKGDGVINAGGSIQKLGDTFGTVLALQDGSFNVNAGKNVTIETAVNPTLVSQSLTNAAALNSTGINAYFNTYSPNATVNIDSLNGNAVYGGGSTILSKVTGLSTVAQTLADGPSRLMVVSNNGDIGIGNVTLLPSPTGDLKVFAANTVNLSNITMSDADPVSLPSINNPVAQPLITAGANTPTSLSARLLTHALQLLHGNDTEQVMVVSQTGDIVSATGSTVILPKSAEFVAGNNIKDLNLVDQNNNASDVTLLKAGNDILIGYTNISGPGNLLVQAGHNIDLTNTAADITTSGNSGSTNVANPVPSNPALSSDGASITLQAGLGKGANVQGYIDQYILPTGAGPSMLAGDPVKLAEYRAATALAVTDYIRTSTGNVNLTDAQALAQFNSLSLEAKTIFANRHLTSELIASAQGFAVAKNHNRGNSAIATLFPTLNSGDILLYASKVSTNSGGSIDLIAPGGLINVGAPGKAVKDAATNSGDIGIITEKGGAIRAVAYSDFQVNQSKVITQFGSDIAIWSTSGTIDAGRGSKTATSIPERIVLTDADGNTTIEVKGVAAGSGIRAQTYDPDGPNGPLIAPKKGNVYLTAPKVDAGEAGIEAGNLLIVAPIVLNAANIQVQGTSSGVPATASTSVVGAGAGLSPDSVNSAVAQVAQSVAQSANQPFVQPALPSIISVDIISIGK